MRLLVAFTFGLLLNFGNSYAAEFSNTGDKKYSINALSKAKSVWYNFTETDDGVCNYKKNIKSLAFPLIDEIEKLGLSTITTAQIDGGKVPDLAVLVALESISASDKVSADICSIFIKVEVLHSLEGVLRYQTDPMIMRVLVHRHIWFGSVKPPDVEKALQSAALRGLALFARDFLNAKNMQK